MSPPPGTYKPGNPNKEIVVPVNSTVSKIIFDLGQFTSGLCLVGTSFKGFIEEDKNEIELGSV